VTLTDRTAAQVVDAAARAVEADPVNFHAALDDIPAAIYVADTDGTITYFNEACIKAVGRRPRVGVDRWCVSWRLYTPEGDALPPDRCPVALALREGREVRGVEIVAERPDGTSARLIPYATPLFDRQGKLCGAVNLLIDVSDQRKPAFLADRAEECLQLATAVDDPHTSEMLVLMAAKYDEQSRKSED
jgi:PAS domain-containing protein